MPWRNQILANMCDYSGMMKSVLLLAAFALQGCAVVGVAATATSSAITVASTGVSLGASGAKTLVSTTSDVVTYPFKEPDPKQP